jgi:hypothetical protein
MQVVGTGRCDVRPDRIRILSVGSDTTMGRRSGWCTAGAVCAFVLVAVATASACGGSENPQPTPTVARTPAEAVRLYNRAIVSGDYAGACRLLTPYGRRNALHDSRYLAHPRKPRPTTCAAALKVVVPPTPAYRELRSARVVRVRPSPENRRRVVVTQRYADGLRQYILVEPRGRRSLLVLNPYSAIG